MYHVIPDEENTLDVAYNMVVDGIADYLAEHQCLNLLTDTALTHEQLQDMASYLEDIFDLRVAISQPEESPDTRCFYRFEVIKE